MVISLAVVAVALSAVIFLSKKMAQISDSIALNHRLEARLETRNELTSVLNRDMQIIGTNNAGIENAFISSDNILGFITTLDNLAKKRSIIQVYRFGTPAPSSISAPFPISTIEYSNSLTTNLSSFSDYIKEFENLPYFTKIDGFTISSQDIGGWLGSSTISFRAILFTKAIQ